MPTRGMLLCLVLALGASTGVQAASDAQPYSTSGFREASAKRGSDLARAPDGTSVGEQPLPEVRAHRGVVDGAHVAAGGAAEPDAASAGSGGAGGGLSAPSPASATGATAAPPPPSVSLWLLLAMTMVMALLSGVGALPYLFTGKLDPYWSGIANAVGCGVMLAASFDLLEESKAYSAGLVLGGIVLGVAAMAYSQAWLARFEDVTFSDLQGADARKAMLIIGVMAAHAFGEGSGVGVSFSGPRGWAQGLLVTIAIGLHNIPEGMAVATIMVARGTPPRTALYWTLLSALPQGIVAVPSYMFVEAFTSLLPIALGFAAGCMIWIVFAELIPDALETADHGHVATAATLSAAALQCISMVIAHLERADGSLASPIAADLRVLLPDLAILAPAFALPCAVAGAAALLLPSLPLTMGVSVGVGAWAGVAGLVSVVMRHADAVEAAAAAAVDAAAGAGGGGGGGGAHALIRHHLHHHHKHGTLLWAAAGAAAAAGLWRALGAVAAAAPPARKDSDAGLELGEGGEGQLAEGLPHGHGGGGGGGEAPLAPGGWVVAGAKLPASPGAQHDGVHGGGGGGGGGVAAGAPGYLGHQQAHVQSHYLLAAQHHQQQHHVAPYSNGSSGPLSGGMPEVTTVHATGVAGGGGRAGGCGVERRNGFGGGGGAHAGEGAGYGVHGGGGGGGHVRGGPGGGGGSGGGAHGGGGGRLHCRANCKCDDCVSQAGGWGAALDLLPAVDRPRECVRAAALLGAMLLAGVLPVAYEVAGGLLGHLGDTSTLLLPVAVKGVALGAAWVGVARAVAGSPSWHVPAAAAALPAVVLAAAVAALLLPLPCGVVAAESIAFDAARVSDRLRAFAAGGTLLAALGYLWPAAAHFKPRRVQMGVGLGVALSAAAAAASAALCAGTPYCLARGHGR